VASIRILILIVMASCAAVLLFRLSPVVQGHQQRPIARAPMAPHLVQEKARAARGDDPTAVRAMTDEIFNQSLLPSAADSLRGRVFRAEVAFRQGSLKAIREETFVKVVNEQLAVLGSPAIAMTNASQIRTLRASRRRIVPDLSEPTTFHDRDAESAMSPAEAVYISLNLAMNKALNPRFRVTPEDWEKNELTLPTAQNSPGKKPALGGLHVSSDLMVVQSTIQHDLGDESSIAVAAAHRFLDELGFPR
jgi:hypothetical protein